MKTSEIIRHIFNRTSVMDREVQARIMTAALDYIATGDMRVEGDTETFMIECFMPMLDEAKKNDEPLSEKRSRAGKESAKKRWNKQEKDNTKCVTASRACDVEINNKLDDITQDIIINPKEEKKEILSKESKEKKEETPLKGLQGHPLPPVAPPPSPANDEPVKRTVFRPPTVEEVRAYCAERGNNVDAQSWWDFYQSKGWMVGSNKMKDWKAAVRTWEQRHKNETKINGNGNYIKNEFLRYGNTKPEDFKGKGHSTI